MDAGGGLVCGMLLRLYRRCIHCDASEAPPPLKLSTITACHPLKLRLLVEGAKAAPNEPVSLCVCVNKLATAAVVHADGPTASAGQQHLLAVMSCKGNMPCMWVH
eukprot:GHRR01004820.1.p4 GENE.GHRR01004820.1~~GHRR01004820.1.p4  ORF type:complete len:105 (+),score=33.70 GHRR01004820.1:943-1257(+)